MRKPQHKLTPKQLAKKEEKAQQNLTTKAYQENKIRKLKSRVLKCLCKDFPGEIFDWKKQSDGLWDPSNPRCHYCPVIQACVDECADKANQKIVTFFK